MRMILNVSLPHEPFNTMVRNGSAGATIGKILETIKPEAVYFTEYDGRRTALLIVNVNQASDFPSLAEPWFLKFQGDCRWQVAMTPEDLQKSGLGELGKKWA